MPQVSSRRSSGPTNLHSRNGTPGPQANGVRIRRLFRALTKSRQGGCATSVTIIWAGPCSTVSSEHPCSRVGGSALRPSATQRGPSCVFIRHPGRSDRPPPGGRPDGPPSRHRAPAVGSASCQACWRSGCGRPAPRAHRLGAAGPRPDDRPGGDTRQGQRADDHPPTSLRTGVDGPRRVHRPHRLPGGRRRDDCRRGRPLLAVKDGESGLHARLRCRGPRPARDRGAGTRPARAAHLHHHGRAPRHPGEIDPDRRWTVQGCAVRMVAERTVHSRTARAVRYYITNLPVNVGAARNMATRNPARLEPVMVL